MSPPSPDLSIVIPVWNEAESLAPLHAELDRSLTGVAGSAEVVFVDDGSSDGSWEVIETLSARDRRVRGLRFRRHHGKSAALAAGFARARGARLVTLDADLQDDPGQIPRLMARLDDGYDLVAGWKRHRQDPWRRRVASRLFNAIAGRACGVRLHDANCGLKAFRREVADAVTLYGELHRFFTFLAARDGFRLAEVEVPHRARAFGRSKYGPGRVLAGAFDLLTVLFLSRFGRKPLHLFGLAGLLLVLAGSAITGWLTFERLVSRVYLSNRPLLLAGVLLIIVGVQLVSIGLVGELLAAHAETTRPAAPYGVRAEVGFDDGP